MRVDEILDALPGVGLRLSNLFQLDNGLWRANTRDTLPPQRHEFGDGDTALEALVACLAKVGIDVSEDEP